MPPGDLLGRSCWVPACPPVQRHEEGPAEPRLPRPVFPKRTKPARLNAEAATNGIKAPPRPAVNMGRGVCDVFIRGRPSGAGFLRGFAPGPFWGTAGCASGAFARVGHCRQPDTAAHLLRWAASWCQVQQCVSRTRLDGPQWPQNASQRAFGASMAKVAGLAGSPPNRPHRANSAILGRNGAGSGRLN